MKTELTYPVKERWGQKEWVAFLRRQACHFEKEAKTWANPKFKKTRLEIAAKLRADADAIEAGLEEV